MATHVCFIDIPPKDESEHHHHRQHHNQPNGHNTSNNSNNNSNSSSSRLSPLSPAHSSPRYERNIGFFQQLSRRFGLRSSDDLVYVAGEDDSQSSSTDSCSSTAATLPAMVTPMTSSAAVHKDAVQNGALLQGSSTEHLSCASSDTSSTVDIHDESLKHRNSNNNNNNNHTTTTQPDATAAMEHKLSSSSTTAKPCSTRSSFTRLQRRSTSSIRRAFEGIALSTRSLSCSGGTMPQPKQRSGSCSDSPAKSVLKTTSTLELHKKTPASLLLSAPHSSSSSASSSSSTSSSIASSAANSKPKSQQRILRQPVSYTYLKGMSGLPTQRVPRSAICCSYSRR